MGIPQIVAKIKDFLLDTIFPIECIGCGKEKVWICTLCFKIVENDRAKEVMLDNRLKVLAVSDYNNPLLQSIIQNFKYGGIKELVKPLSLILQNGIQKFIKFSKNFIVIPVPLHRRKMLERGFNQNELLAYEIFPKEWIHTDKLIKVRYTKPQVNLKRGERLKNVLGSFKVREADKIKGKNILLIDDVLTTGSTLIECAKTLKEAGAKKIMAVVLAYDSFDFSENF